MHRDRPGRPSLALDLMEELRPALADRLALSLINRRQLRASDFRTQESGAVLLCDDARKTVLTAWQERKREERRHAFLDEKPSKPGTDGRRSCSSPVRETRRLPPAMWHGD
ncbi:MAG: CRISPR-associated endonuclease Cas1 [Aquamicrobium sp.]|uniref:CRISPR-associated endonuclease Cas1 n=1 Tax=Aquamicrobium sp. TaxID=1872579 RepID=UPI00349EA271|nr:CRISPR-associated endonuclease Cas1 [Aquamicrobium sp.]